MEARVGAYAIMHAPHARLLRVSVDTFKYVSLDKPSILLTGIIIIKQTRRIKSVYARLSFTAHCHLRFLFKRLQTDRKGEKSSWRWQVTVPVTVIIFKVLVLIVYSSYVFMWTVLVHLYLCLRRMIQSK